MQNVTIALPEELKSQLENAALTDGGSVAEIYREAAERYLAHRDLNDLGRRGSDHAQAHGLRASDVLRLIDESRRGR